MNLSQSAFFSRKLGNSTLMAKRRRNGNYDVTIIKGGKTLNALDMSLSYIKRIANNLQDGRFTF